MYQSHVQLVYSAGSGGCCHHMEIPNEHDVRVVMTIVLVVGASLRTSYGYEW